MPRREVSWGVARRHALLHKLGDRCAKCGLRLDESPTGDLDYFHVNHVKTTVPSNETRRIKMGSHNRAALLWREYEAGVQLSILCKGCNGWDGAKKRKTHGTGNQRGGGDDKA